MNFNTILYLAFLPLALLAYFLVPARLKNLCLLAASMVFYLSCTTPGYVVFLWAAICLTYFAALALSRTQCADRRLVFWGALVLDLALLCFFKYNRYFAPQLAPWLKSVGFPYVGGSDGAVRLLMPLGISYYTFQSVGYLVDVSQHECPAERNFVDYALFVSFFPQVVAGPIGRAGKLLPQLKETHSFDYGRTVRGLRLMLLGYFKKIAVADILAMYVDSVYNGLSGYTGLTLTFATVLYAMYLYCDFSGYSDIARGSAELFGIELTENFNTPYLSTSFSQFWERWHISLSLWLQDYLFTPLVWSGWMTRLPFIGKKVKNPPIVSSIIIVFLVSGLWHGVGMTFFLWGALHALYRAGETVCWKYAGRPPKKPKPLRRTLSTVRVFALVTFSYIFFRSATLADAWYVITRQFSDWRLSSFVSQSVRAIGTGFNSTPLLVAGYALFALLGCAAVVWGDWHRMFRLKGRCLSCIFETMSAPRRWAVYYALLLFILAAFIMRNGNYVGSVSFAYGGF